MTQHSENKTRHLSLNLGLGSWQRVPRIIVWNVTPNFNLICHLLECNECTTFHIATVAMATMEKLFPWLP